MTNGMMNNKATILEENYKSCVKEGETASFAEWEEFLRYIESL